MSRIVRASSRTIVCLGLVGVMVVSSLWLLHAEQGGASRTAANPAYFTGNAFTLDTTGFILSRMGFEAAARANWHTHVGPQFLFAQEGALRAQVAGGPLQNVPQGQGVYLPGGVAHWHGASPGEASTQVAINFPSAQTRVMEKVTDAQYAGDGGRNR